ncbi:hypothetical protein STEG23_022633 [Scotinomys teguina]
MKGKKWRGSHPQFLQSLSVSGPPPPSLPHRTSQPIIVTTTKVAREDPPCNREEGMLPSPKIPMECQGDGEANKGACGPTDKSGSLDPDSERRELTIGGCFRTPHRTPHLHIGKEKKAETWRSSQDWREREESLALCLLETTAQAGPKKPSQPLPSGFGCECTIGEAFHPLCIPHRTVPR